MITREEILNNIQKTFPKKEKSIGLSQLQAAQFIGVSSTTLSRWRDEGKSPECIKASDSRYIYIKSGLADFLLNLKENEK